MDLGPKHCCVTLAKSLHFSEPRIHLKNGAVSRGSLAHASMCKPLMDKDEKALTATGRGAVFKKTVGNSIQPTALLREPALLKEVLGMGWGAFTPGEVEGLDSGLSLRNTAW